MIRKWLFVDEQPDEATNCKRLLAQPGEFQVDIVPPEPDVAFLRRAIDQSTDGVLLDHALNDAKADIQYAGSTLAAYIRTEYPALPIVVLSAKLKDPGELRRYRRTQELFDWTVDKHDLLLKAANVRESLKVLGDGYKKLNAVLTGNDHGGYREACRVLGIPEDVEDDTERAAVARLLLETGTADPSRVAHFLLQVALRLPGPLLDRRRAAVAAGLTPEGNGAIDAHIAPARYKGIFAEFYEGGRYWREQLNELRTERGGLAPAECVACGEEASELCEVCEKPVDGLHSLPVRRKEAANDVFLRGRACGFCLAGDLPAFLTIDGRYAEMQAALVAQVRDLQDQHR
jgi:hypothetical protein